MPDPRSDRRRTILVTIAVLLFVGSVVAVLAGGFTPRATQPPLAYDILEPGEGSCATCHGGNWDSGRVIEPYDAWAGSMMANAARDPLFWAALDVANQDAPGIGDFCLRCHVPTGWYAGRSEPPGGTVDGCALLGEIDRPNNDFEGISCHFCHRAMINPSPPPGEQGFYLENGQIWLDDGDCGGAGEPCRRGPYDYPGGEPPPPPHVWAYSAYHRSATLCGNCHNVTSPVHNLIDENGIDTGVPYPIERTYREWELSDFAPGGATPATCQQCHMPMVTDPGTNGSYACIMQMTDRTGDMRAHQFAGANTWIPAVLKAEYGAPGQLDREQNYDDTIAFAGELLHSAAEVDVVAPAGIPPGNPPIDLDVRVTNLSGHKLPTGYPEGRRLWLQLTATDRFGEIVWQSGAWDPATGVLTEDAQVKIYEGKPGIWDSGDQECKVTDGDGDPAFHFVLNDCWAKDNRIPPLGFTGGADLEVRPVAYGYPETFPGSGELVNYDDTAYSIPVPAGTPGPITVETRLLYQTASKEYVEFLRDQAVEGGFPDDCIPRSTGSMMSSRGEILYDLWVEHGRSAPFEMDAVVTVVQLDLFADGFESGDTSAWSATSPLR
ncbi:MAG: hypothetical protein AMXMBFR36_24510 [Acidobacteriota bacterium]